MNLYVGNLPYRMTEDELQQTFGQFGHVISSTIIKDKMTGRSKGFGFIEMPDDSQAREAIAGLNGKEVQARKLVVEDARRRGE